MVWVPGIDYPTAQQYVGYPVSVLAGGTVTGATPLADNDGVIGWRAGCDCGWRGRQFYPRAEWPSSAGAVPAAVEGLSWAQIGEAAGISADHAARRWVGGGLGGERPPTTRRADRSPHPDTGPTR